MIEIVVKNYLAAQISDVPVCMEIPEDVPTTYIVIEKTGSTNADGAESAVFAVQSIAPTLYEAATLNERVKAVMAESAANCDEIFNCQLNSDYNWTNTNTKERRYQAVFNIYYKE